MATILLDENIDGYAEYLARSIFSSTWSDIASLLGVRIMDAENLRGTGRLYLP